MAAKESSAPSPGLGLLIPPPPPPPAAAAIPNRPQSRYAHRYYMYRIRKPGMKRARSTVWMPPPPAAAAIPDERKTRLSDESLQRAERDAYAWMERRCEGRNLARTDFKSLAGFIINTLIARSPTSEDFAAKYHFFTEELQQRYENNRYLQTVDDLENETVSDIEDAKMMRRERRRSMYDPDFVIPDEVNVDDGDDDLYSPSDDYDPNEDLDPDDDFEPDDDDLARARVAHALRKLKEKRAARGADKKKKPKKK